jgi:ABC-type branched-subunit amino acid transport system ATPase component
VLVLGGAAAGLSGAILVGFINLWAPAAWGYAETIVLFAAVIIGGAGNHRGAMLGAILVPVGFLEATRYIPQFGQPGLIDDLQWVTVGLLIVVFLWLRPQGILPEPRRVIAGLAQKIIPPNEDVVAAGPDVLGSAEPALQLSERMPAEPTLALSEPGETVLQAVDVVREFGGMRAVDGVGFEIHRGTLTGLIGPNGAGKSTTLAMLAGTLPATSGQVLYLGRDVTGVPAFRRARAGLVRTFQLASEFKRLTVMENLLSAVGGQRGDSLRGALLGKRYWRGDEAASAERALAMLERFGLEKYANSYAGDLSGGQRRLVEIMRALMAEPQVLLLDEPMAGVHPHLARQIGGELLELCAGGMTIVMVEHELAIMDEFCDPVIVMAEGRVLAEGTMRALRERSEVVEAYLVG